MALSRIATVIGGLLLSKRGRGFAGRHAGKLALATLAFELWQNHRQGSRGRSARPAASAKTRPLRGRRR